MQLEPAKYDIRSVVSSVPEITT